MMKNYQKFFQRFSFIILFGVSVILFLIIDYSLKKTIVYFSATVEDIYIKHPIYNHTFKKNSQIKVKHHLVENYEIITNSLGFKDKKSRYINQTSPKKRIVFIGDSFTEGVMLNYEDTFIGMIDKKLSTKNIEVLNAARSSYSPIIYWKKIEHLIKVEKLEFNELVVFIDISDNQDEVERYELNSGRVIYQQEIAEVESLKKKIKSFINNNFIITYKISDFVFDTLRLNTEERKRKEIIQKMEETQNFWMNFINFSHNRDKWTIDNQAYEQYGKEGIVKMSKYMKKLKKLLDIHNIKMIIAVYPWVSQIWYEDLNSLQVKIWKEFSRENNIKFINFFPHMVKKGISENQKLDILKKYYIPYDLHFNKNGNQLISKIFLNEYLKE